MLCTLIVSQMLPEAVAVKGGMGVKLRLGEHGTRATSDLDVSTRARGAELERKFRERLAEGWGRVPPSRGELKRNQSAADRVAFTATIRVGRVHDPGLAFPEYVMHPYRVSIAFLGVPWGGLDVEVSDPEIDADAHQRFEIVPDLVAFGSRFGFGKMEPVELVELEYQLAQKIHAVTDPNYTRAHDLVDLQLLWETGPDLFKLSQLCVRTFEWRNKHSWPPLPLREMDGWALAYNEAREETQVHGETAILPDLQRARDWLAEKIKIIAETETNG
ncbi:nucleotidyl transferase AbiEii/AbiGii toxin family protein [Leucobacter sp. W1153]|uniref:nucleotidyl transferase AbiEii/AbiGii toxin family protein n=1 Tax=Leucobacter sp. W1153 TaxID=3439064 RepID=UPI003F33E9E3